MVCFLFLLMGKYVKLLLIGKAAVLPRTLDAAEPNGCYWEW